MVNFCESLLRISLVQVIHINSHTVTIDGELWNPHEHIIPFRAQIDFRKTANYAINLIKCARKVFAGRVLYSKLDAHILRRARVI